MPEKVRVQVHRQPLPPRPVRDPGLDRSWADAPSAATGEHGGFTVFGEVRPGTQPRFKRCHGLAADRHDTHLPALAGDPYGAVRQVEVGQIEVDDVSGRMALEVFISVPSGDGERVSVGTYRIGG
jgi:hypothetical protein